MKHKKNKVLSKKDKAAIKKALVKAARHGNASDINDLSAMLEYEFLRLNAGLPSSLASFKINR
ncbi:hypothetical protein [Neisseria bergeri]|uniref:hypothetical protein n=1 Tax=Neisseria bergeri TaxID=1906581 RepID=UPI00272B1224